MGLCGRPCVLELSRSGNGCENLRFVGLEDLARGCVELDAVAVKRDVAARHHDAWAAQREPLVREGRSRKESEVADLHARVANGLGDGAHDAALGAVRGGAKVAAEGNGCPRHGDAAREHHSQEAGGVDVGLEVRDVLDLAPQAGRPKAQRSRGAAAESRDRTRVVGHVGTVHRKCGPSGAAQRAPMRQRQTLTALPYLVESLDLGDRVGS